jgi:YVTN family beta-propeller protein
MLRIASWLVALSLGMSVAQAGSASSLMDLSPDGKTLVVANTDSGTISIVDLKERKKIVEIPVGDHPEGVSWAGPNLALVTVYGDDTVVYIDTSAHKAIFTLKVPDEPYGIVTTSDGSRAFITHDYLGSYSEIDVLGRKVLRTVKIGHDCRGLAIAKDEMTLYATEFYSAKLLAIDRSSGKVTDSWAGPNQDNLARHVVLHPTRPKAYISHIRSRITDFDARGSIFPHISFCDLTPAKEGESRRRSKALDTFNGNFVVTNPWEAALSPDGKRIYKIFAGTDDMYVSEVLDDDYVEIERIGRAVPVGKHPRAVAVSRDGKEVYVYNTLDYSIMILDSLLQKRLGNIPVATPAHTPEWRRGKELFQSALQPMGSARWIACSSDGLSDGRVWQNPEGHRKTPNLFGLAHTHPLHWSGDRDESQDFEYTIRGKLMQGRGLARGSLKPRTSFTEFAESEQKTSGLSKDLDAMAIYTNSFGFRLSPHIPAPGQLSEAGKRGKALFENTTTNCASCHSGSYYSDSRLQKPQLLHDVGTGDAPTEKVGPKFDTPTLLGVYRINSYLHDGRAKTLHDVLTTHNKADRHGKTSHLKKEELDDLVEFLKSLPYELPPTETPNTVPYRLK